MAEESQASTNQALPQPTQAQMNNEIATIDKVVYDTLFYGGNFKILFNGDSVLRTRGGAKGLALYDDLERDAHCGSVIDKRKRAVTAREWSVEPAEENNAHDQEVADFVKDALDALRFDKLCKDLLDGILKGFAVVETVWTVRDGKIVPERCIARDQRRFVFDIDRRPRLITREKMLEGEELPDRKFIVHSVGGKDGSPYGLGLGHRLFWPVFFKRQGITFWLIFADKFGAPTVVGKYPSGSTPEGDQQKLLNAIQAISHEAGVAIPEGMTLELLEASKTNPSDFYESMCQYMDSEISKAVLGETLTTTVGNTGGNRALGTVHDDIRMEVAKDDADDLCATLNNTLVKWLVDLNYPGSAYPEIWRNFDVAEDMDTIADRDVKLKSIGWERDDQSFQDTYGEGYVRVQQPTPDAVTTSNKAVPAGSDPSVGFSEAEHGIIKTVKRWLGFAEPNAVEQQRQRKHADQEIMAEGAAQQAGNWEQLLGARVKELQTVLDQTGDLALFSERLQEMIAAEPDQNMVDALARATFASRLAGRSSRGKPGARK